MNRIRNLFRSKEKNILSIYFTAGFPELNNTVEVITALEKNQVDLIEIGIPFSDPLADGPVIQHSSEVALNNGMTLKLLFEQLKEIRQQVKLPLILMGYFNPVMQFGVEAFCKQCAVIGIDGVIIPDLPMDIYLEQYKQIFEKYNLLNIFLITPQTSDERIRFIDSHSNGFIYMVSSSSTTGAKSNIQSGQEKYFQRIKTMKLKNPTLIGFGISNHETFTKASENSNGAIIGSAFVKALEGNNEIEKCVNMFVSKIKNRNTQVAAE